MYAVALRETWLVACDDLVIQVVRLGAHRWRGSGRASRHHLLLKSLKKCAQSPQCVQIEVALQATSFSSVKHQVAFLDETVLLCRIDKRAFWLVDVVLRGSKCVMDSSFQLCVGDSLVRSEHVGDHERHFDGRARSFVGDLLCWVDV